MIVFDIQCGNGHVFEGWFADSASFDAQVKAKDVACPMCGDTAVEKALMTPSVAVAPRTGGSAEEEAPDARTVALAKQKEETRRVMAMARAVKAHVEKNFENVGPQHGGDDQLCDAVAVTDREGAAGVAREGHVDQHLAAVVAVDGAEGDGDSLARQPRSRSDLHLAAGRGLDGDARADELGHSREVESLSGPAEVGVEVEAGAAWGCAHGKASAGAQALDFEGWNVRHRGLAPLGCR